MGEEKHMEVDLAILAHSVLRRSRASRTEVGGSATEDKREKTQLITLPNQEKSQY